MMLLSLKHLPINENKCQICLTIQQNCSKYVYAKLKFFDFQGGHFDSKDFLCFYYYGGMIYTALKKFDRALYFFEIVSIYRPIRAKRYQVTFCKF